MNSLQNSKLTQGLPVSFNGIDINSMLSNVMNMIPDNDIPKLIETLKEFTLIYDVELDKLNVKLAETITDT